LPHHLVASFKATLEETVNADLLLHVVDASSIDVFEQIKSVESVLKELNCDQKEMVVLLNKSDSIADKATFESVQTVFPEALSVSAKTGLKGSRSTSSRARHMQSGQRQTAKLPANGRAGFNRGIL
jgi:GTP-binding protein HflX